MKSDYYHILGVKSNANKDEIKHAFRRLAKQYHPSVSNNPEAEEIFKSVNSAYQVLSDDDNRKLYDKYGPAYIHYVGRKPSPARGRDRTEDLTLSLEEVVFGVEKEIYFQHFEMCSQCSGTGMTIDQICGTCGGEGHQQNETTKTISFSPGVSDGLRIMVRGGGEYLGNDSIRGDLCIVVHIKPHKTFNVKGLNIILEVTISQEQAVEGDTLKIPTIDGDIDLVVPPNTSHGHTIRLDGLGIPWLNSDGTSEEGGDQIVKLNVEGMTESSNGLIQKLSNFFKKT